MDLWLLVTKTAAHAYKESLTTLVGDIVGFSSRLLLWLYDTPTTTH